jgi:hypothetical protein
MNDQYTQLYGYADVYTTDQEINPIIVSPNTHIQLSFMQTKQTLKDPELYQRFLANCESRFRNSAFYKNYKSFLYSIGLDHCQIHGNISSEMADLEMHHNMLTLFDLAFIICEHMLNSGYCVDTYRIIQLLKKEHSNHHVQLVMLSKTPHQAYHNSNGCLFLPPNMAFGYWFEFLKTYPLGISKDIAFKIIGCLDKAKDTNGKITDNGLLNIRNFVLEWSQYNDINFK